MRETTTSQVLSRYPDRFQPAGKLEPLGGAGGLSGATLWRYPSAAGPMALRAWPDVSTHDHVQNIHDWLRDAADLRYLAFPVVARDGRSIAELGGRLWQLEPWMPGVPDLAEPPSASRLDAAISGLARLHARLAGRSIEGTSPGMTAAALELEALMSRDLDRLESALDGAPTGANLVAGRQWIALARALIPRHLPGLHDAARLRVRLQPCLRDARPEHFLFEGERLTGLVDYGAMGIETVAADLARLTGEWLEGDLLLQARAISVYQMIRPLDASERALVSAFEVAADLLIGAHWLRWRWLEPRRFEDPAAVSKGLDRGIRRLARRSDRAGLMT